MGPENQPQQSEDNSPPSTEVQQQPVFQPQPDLQINPLASQPQSSSSAPKSRGLSIASLVLSFVFFPAGLAIGIICLVRAKKSNTKDGLALAGTIISSVYAGLAILAIIVICMFVPVIIATLNKCKELGDGTHIIDGVTYTCSGVGSGTVTDTNGNILTGKPFDAGLTKDYTALGYMDYIMPDSWTYNENKSASIQYKSYVFDYKDSASVLTVKASSIYGGTSYDSMTETIVGTYQEPESKVFKTINDKQWYHITTQDYTSSELVGHYHSEIYFHVSEQSNNMYYFEFDLSNGLDDEGAALRQKSIDYILESATLLKDDK